MMQDDWVNAVRREPKIKLKHSPKRELAKGIALEAIPFVSFFLLIKAYLIVEKGAWNDSVDGNHDLR